VFYLCAIAIRSYDCKFRINTYLLTRSRELVLEVMVSRGCRYDGNALLSCIEVYNQQTESWELLEKSMTTQRCDAGLTVVHLR